MASIGPLNPGTMANVVNGGNAWSNINNALTSNDSYSTVFLGDGAISDYLKATNFGFTVPTDATILGITVSIERKSDVGSGINDNSIKIVKADVISGTDQNAGAVWPTSDTAATFGGASNLWGLSWTPADINGSTFGVAMACVGAIATASVDTITITVTYSGGSQIKRLLPCLGVGR